MQKTKKRGSGFTYAEVIVATAIFAIAVAGGLSLSMAAARNLALARRGAELSMAANSIALALRDMILVGDEPDAEAVRALAESRGAPNYRIHVLASCGAHMFGSPYRSRGSGDGADTAIAGTVHGGAYALVYVETLNDFSAVAGRALCFAVDLGVSEDFWRRFNE